MIYTSCCIPGGSFMPEGEGSLDTAYDRLMNGYRVITSLGYDRVEATVGLVMQLSEEETARLVEKQRAGCFSLVACNSFIGLPVITDESGTQALYDFVDRAMERMSLLGVKLVVFGSGRARSVPDGYDRAKGETMIDAFLTHCNGCCEKYGMTLVIEPLNKNETNWVNLVSEGAAVVRRLDLPHVRLLADGFHMAQEGEDPSVMAKNRDILRHTHIAAAPKRTYPGSGDGVYETKFLRTLTDMGYEGTVTVECGFTDFAEEARLAADFLKKNLGR